MQSILRCQVNCNQPTNQPAEVAVTEQVKATSVKNFLKLERLTCSTASNTQTVPVPHHARSTPLPLPPHSLSTNTNNFFDERFFAKLRDLIGQLSSSFYTISKTYCSTTYCDSQFQVYFLSRDSCAVCAIFKALLTIHAALCIVLHRPPRIRGNALSSQQETPHSLCCTSQSQTPFPPP